MACGNAARGPTATIAGKLSAFRAESARLIFQLGRHFKLRHIGRQTRAHDVVRALRLHARHARRFDLRSCL